MAIRASHLYQDLHSDSRDLMYRAMTYITRCGGPTIIGPPDELANLLASREPMLEWLLGRPEKDRIIEEYAEYLERWSPVFID